MELPKNNENPVQPEEIYSFEEMREIKPAMEALLKKIKDKIDEGYYTSLVSDEVGGRIPTLILSSVIKRVYQDKKKLGVFFMPAGYRNIPTHHPESNYKKEIAESIGKKLSSENKVLLVTQYLRSGKSITEILHMLEKNGIRADIATMNSVMSEDVLSFSNISYLEYKDGTDKPKIFVGKETEEGDPAIDNERVRTALGVQKNTDGFIEVNNESTAQVKQLLRSDIDLMANRLYQEIWAE